jgi:hypothetical protein
VKVEILDAQGGLIRDFTARAPDDATGAARAPRVRPTEHFGALPSTTRGPGITTGFPAGFGGGTRAGLNVFRWDLRHPGPTTFPGMIFWGAGTQGPLAVPGQYQAG